MQFYKETEFKKVELNGRIVEIPKDWEVVRLGCCADIIMGQSPPSFTYNTEGKGLPFLQGCAEFGEIYPKPKIYCSNPIKIAEASDILLSVRAPVGEVNIAPSKCCIGRGLAAIRTKESRLHYLFLFYYLKFNSNVFEKIAMGSTFKAIKKNDIENLKIPLPRQLEEQKKIAEVLSTVDKAIEKTDEAIERTKRIKKGLMQRLLTKGIGHKEFRKVELNGIIVEIPKDWGVVKLEDVITEAKPGFACGKRDDNGIIQLRMDSIDPDGRINPNAYVKVPPPENVNEYLLKSGDILFVNTIGSLELLGKSAIFKGEHTKCTYSNHLTRIRVDFNRTIPEWILYHLIRYRLLGIFRNLCHRHAGGQAMVSRDDLLNLKIPLPRQLEEQKKIAEILSTVDNKMDILRKEKEKLENIKKGLMQKLLTGKVRVVV